MDFKLRFVKYFNINDFNYASNMIYFCQAVISVKVSNLLICFCSFDLCCRILEEYNFIENVIVLSCLTT